MVRISTTNSSSEGGEGEERERERKRKRKDSVRERETIKLCTSPEIVRDAVVGHFSSPRGRSVGCLAWAGRTTLQDSMLRGGEK